MILRKTRQVAILVHPSQSVERQASDQWELVMEIMEALNKELPYSGRWFLDLDMAWKLGTKSRDIVCSIPNPKCAKIMHDSISQKSWDWFKTMRFNTQCVEFFYLPFCFGNFFKHFSTTMKARIFFFKWTLRFSHNNLFAGVGTLSETANSTRLVI